MPCVMALYERLALLYLDQTGGGGVLHNYSGLYRETDMKSRSSFTTLLYRTTLFQRVGKIVFEFKG